MCDRHSSIGFSTYDVYMLGLEFSKHDGRVRGQNDLSLFATTVDVEFGSQCSEEVPSPKGFQPCLELINELNRSFRRCKPLKA